MQKFIKLAPTCCLTETVQSKQLSLCGTAKWVLSFPNSQFLKRDARFFSQLLPSWIVALYKKSCRADTFRPTIVKYFMNKGRSANFLDAPVTI